MCIRDSNYTFVNNKNVTTFPYLENFEEDNGGWMAGGFFSTWQWGQPRKSIIHTACLLYTSDAADERSSVDLGGRRIIKKKNNTQIQRRRTHEQTRTQHTR